MTVVVWSVDVVDLVAAAVVIDGGIMGVYFVDDCCWPLVVGGWPMVSLGR